MTDGNLAEDNNQSSGLSGDASSSAPANAMPSIGWRSRCLVLLVMLHLFLVWVSLGSSVRPSQWTSSVLQAGHVYLQSTHFGVDGRPVYLAHGKPEEQPLKLELDGVELMPETIPGAGADDRQQRWLATARMLATQEQPSLVAELMLGLMRHQKNDLAELPEESAAIAPTGESEEQSGIVSLLREPTILSSVLDDQEPPAYQARVVVDGNRIAVVRLLPERLTAISRVGESGSDTNRSTSYEQLVPPVSKQDATR